LKVPPRNWRQPSYAPPGKFITGSGRCAMICVNAMREAASAATSGRAGGAARIKRCVYGTKQEQMPMEAETPS